ncbi:Mnd1 family-domain-containing protein [Dioszegia hungarica]|uniref:Meiotic nuclear division protein 1 n=1 Tax=Dioszegia hungarica TaxID=4972 RepID=A0AA38H5B5_9TREE|nr:Mnd1 family-domain-containing protein [Dioszegia hungarica]KAI9632794.1 Mnd1 family-domain-containing protein [Dioszegia hungarica]
MAPRGLSAAEKKIKMLEIFHETKEFFTLKEMEKHGPSKSFDTSHPLHFSWTRSTPPFLPDASVAQQTVKETLDDLVGDGLVNFDKIGTSNYFWAFPSAAGAAKQAAVDKANKELESVTARIAQVQAALVAAQKGREDTADRKKLLVTLDSARATNIELKTELDAYGAADPVKYERKKRAIEVCKESALRWTDNSVAAMQYGRATLGVDTESLKHITGIDDLDEWEELKL